ncbi:DUF4142 domain-containing protein [Sandarakinorhabdus rubra]|uniref:DUF4142 domain-containing protein n=1 Tax=Sandarakinorhabdus rubra TaxID=2672568 RepID=UPI0013DD123D|nr:DUF4142 domain-containing protein [Sandarakinorhabdus rubra]
MKNYLLVATVTSFSLGSLALAGCGESARDPASKGRAADGSSVGNGGDPVPPLPPPMRSTDNRGVDRSAASAPGDYVAAAASGDQFEIQSSRLVLERSRSDLVKGFARTMVEDHRTATERLKAVAQQVSLEAPRATMLPKHLKQLEELRSAGGNLDQLYLTQQRAAHAEAIDLHRGMSSAAGMPKPLGLFARDMLSRVEGHARMLDGITLSPAAI